MENNITFNQYLQSKAGDVLSEITKDDTFQQPLQLKTVSGIPKFKTPIVVKPKKSKKIRFKLNE